MAEFSEFRLDRDLDNWWNRLTAHEATLPEPEPLRADIATVRFLASHHTAPNPDPAFVRNLETELMAQAKTSTGMTTMPTAFVPTTPVRVRPIFWREQRRRIWGLIELTAVAALILMFLGAASGDGPFGGLNSVWQEADEGSGEVGMYRGNAARTGVMPGPGPSGQPVLVWKKRFDDFNYSGLVVAVGGRVYLTQSQWGEVIALDVETSEVIWTATVGQIDRSPVAVGNGLVYVATAGRTLGGTDAGYLIALDETTGKEQWRYQTGGTKRASPAVVGDIVYITAIDQTLRAVDAITGQERWRFDLLQQSASTPMNNPRSDDYFILEEASPAVADGLVYAANNRGTLFAVDTSNGSEKWRFQTLGNVAYTPAIANGTVYFSTFLQGAGGSNTLKGAIYAIDAKTGAKRWEQQGSIWSQSAPTVADGLVFVGSTGDAGTTDDAFSALDATTGNFIWKYLTGNLNSEMIYSHGIVYGTKGSGGLFAIEAKTGKLVWQIDVGNLGPLAPTLTNGFVLVPSLDGALYAFAEPQSGATPEASPSHSIDTAISPQCAPPGPFPEIHGPTGTPTSPLIPGRGIMPGNNWPPILLSEIPQGKEASDDVDAEILETLNGMAACGDNWQALLGFYSNDFLSRSTSGMNHSEADYYLGADRTHVLGMDGQPATTFDDARELPDGRVGVIIMGSRTATIGSYVVFVEQDGHWLIDEQYVIVAVAPFATPTTEA